MKDPLGVSPSKGNQGTTRGKEKFLLRTSVGIEPTTSGLDQPLLCRLSSEVGQRMSGTIKNIGHHTRLKEKEHLSAIELSLREISFVVYVHTLVYARTNDAKIVRSRDVQCTTGTVLSCY